MEEENLSVLLQGIMTMTNEFYVKNISPKRCTQLPHLSAVLAFITWPMRFSYSHYSQYLPLLSKAKMELNTI